MQGKLCPYVRFAISVIDHRLLPVCYVSGLNQGSEFYICEKHGSFCQDGRYEFPKMGKECEDYFKSNPSLVQILLEAIRRIKEVLPKGKQQIYIHPYENTVLIEVRHIKMVNSPKLREDIIAIRREMRPYLGNNVFITDSYDPPFIEESQYKIDFKKGFAKVVKRREKYLR